MADLVWWAGTVGEERGCGVAVARGRWPWSGEAGEGRRSDSSGDSNDSSRGRTYPDRAGHAPRKAGRGRAAYPA
ncbi:hypothetical protein ACJOT3_18150 [Nocardiopsis sp. frass1]